jgi:hypothetical protein
LTTAICGATTFGILLFYYFVDRSADHVLPYVSLPLLLSATLWLTLVGRARGWASRPARGVTGLAAATAVLLFAVAWSSLGGRVAASPLGKLVPGGQSLPASMKNLWNLPPLDSGTEAGERLIARYFPANRPVPVVIEPEQEEELLFRTDRTTPLAFSEPYEDSFAGSAFLNKLGSRVDSLTPGSRLLLSEASFRVLRALRADLGRDPITDPIVMQKHPLTVPQQWVLARIAQRFSWRVLTRDPAGFVVLALRG